MLKLAGEVIKGKQKGRRIGFPTANIRLSLNIPTGVYAGEVILGKKKYKAAIFLGYKQDLEAHLIGLSRSNFYGKTIEVRLGLKIREREEFKDDETLKEKIEEDVEIIKSMKNVYGNN